MKPLGRPTLADVRAAADRIGRAVERTALVPSAWLSQLSRADVFLKLETAQATGSYKVRGALNALARMQESRPDVATVVTASAGNHGAALAWAARRLGLTARVYLPVGAPEAKRRALTDLGADIVAVPSYDEAETQAHEDAARTGTPFVSAYSDSDVIAGAGTVALEVLEERSDVDTFVVPLGGGGLISGTAIVAREVVHGALVFGAEADASPVFTAALAAGHPVIVDVRPTLADGLAGNMEPDSQTFGIVRDLVDRVVRVREPFIERAMRELSLRERLVAEGAGATAVGALLSGDLDVAGRRVAVIVSGRNVDPDVIARVTTA
jgi:threonine dehydratase